MSFQNERLEKDLDRLWVEYRSACGEPEGTRDFMPQLWSKIEARQTVSFTLRRLTQAFVTAAAAASLLFAALQVSTHSTPAFYSATYAEVLAGDQISEAAVYQDWAGAEAGSERAAPARVENGSR